MLGDIIYPSIYKNEYVTQIVLNDADDNPYVLLEVEKE